MSGRHELEVTRMLPTLTCACSEDTVEQRVTQKDPRQAEPAIEIDTPKTMMMMLL
jgi:hypothetical protein